MVGTLKSLEFGFYGLPIQKGKKSMQVCILKCKTLKDFFVSYHFNKDS